MSEVRTPGGLIVVGAAPAQEPAFGCLVCGAQFYEDEMRAYERHVVHCSDVNEDVIREASLRHRAPFFYDTQNEGPVDLRKWLRENRDAVLEGRKRL